MSTLSVVGVVIALTFLLTWSSKAVREHIRDRLGATQRQLAEKWTTSSELEASAIQPLNEFDWQKTAPRQYRPLKAKYHITMAIQQTEPSELIIIDENYLERVQTRRETILNHHSDVVGCTPDGVEAVSEVYTYLLSDYLPKRYPGLFQTDEKAFHNLVTGARFPLAVPDHPVRALEILGETVEDDIFLLKATPEGHLCTAFMCCHASGFNPAEKMGKLLKDIHAPVPHYDKIGPSMERFFAKLEVGKSVYRVNWTITQDPVLFKPSGNHVLDGDVVDEDVDVDIEKARLRCELQTLTRLPKTQAILFSFKTYLYKITDLKAEGIGPQLADAIEGMKQGNAPGMYKYKGAVRWGRSVCEYLRS